MWICFFISSSKWASISFQELQPWNNILIWFAFSSTSFRCGFGRYLFTWYFYLLLSKWRFIRSFASSAWKQSLIKLLNHVTHIAYRVNNKSERPNVDGISLCVCVCVIHKVLSFFFIHFNLYLLVFIEPEYFFSTSWHDVAGAPWMNCWLHCFMYIYGHIYMLICVIIFYKIRLQCVSLILKIRVSFSKLNVTIIYLWVK